MKLWRVENGWQGNGMVHVLVIAETKEQAIDLARLSFNREAWNPGRANFPVPRYGENYWQGLCGANDSPGLRVKVLCDDVSAEWASRPLDE